jgi:DUF971 family protein
MVMFGGTWLRHLSPTEMAGLYPIICRLFKNPKTQARFYVENIPVEIKVYRNTKVLTIQWKDDHISEYSFSLLRNACPCVECRGGHDQMSDRPDPGVFKLLLENSERTRLENVVSVGSYAISIEWEDGHSTGIYNWDYLRLLCPCPRCRLA